MQQASSLWVHRPQMRAPCVVKATSSLANGQPSVCSLRTRASVADFHPRRLAPPSSSQRDAESSPVALATTTQGEEEQKAVSAGAGPVTTSTAEEDEAFPLPVEEAAEPTTSGPPVVAGLFFLGGLAVLLAGGYVFKDQIKTFLTFFIGLVEDLGPFGYVAYALVYTGLEVLAVPAIPLTMTAGAIFGPIPGTLITSASGTVAATIAFVIARYAARDKIMKFAKRNPKFAAIDRAIAKDGFKFVTLLRLSPLLPLAVSNYIYGLTSVDLGSYVLGSWLGMLPGTYAYVSAGHIGKAVFIEGEGQLDVASWQVALGLGVTLLAIGYVGQLAKRAIDEVDEAAGKGKPASTSGAATGNGSSTNGIKPKQ